MYCWQIIYQKKIVFNNEVFHSQESKNNNNNKIESGFSEPRPCFDYIKEGAEHRLNQNTLHELHIINLYFSIEYIFHLQIK